MPMHSADAVAHAPAPAGAEASGLDQFLVPATISLQERRPRTLKHGDTFGVFDRNGDIIAGPGSPDGLYHRDTRYLSHFFLTLDGARPMLLSSTLRDDNATLTCDLTNPDLFDGQEQLVLPHDLVHVRRSRFLWQGKCYERVSLRSFDEEPRTVRLILDFAADFADLFEVRGTHRERRGTLNPARVEAASVALSYTGLDKVTRTTTLSFDPKPQTLTAKRAAYEVELPPRETQLVFIEISCGMVAQPAATRRSFFVALRDARRALRYASSRAASVATSNDVFNEAARRGVSDIYTLITETPESPTLTPASPGSARCSAATPSSPRCRCCGSILRSPRACCATSPPTRRPPSMGRPMRSPARSCMRYAMARWPSSARVPFRR